MSRLHVGLVVIAYNQPALMERLVEAARASRSELAVYLFRHSRDEATRRLCQRLAAAPDVCYHEGEDNRGVSRSWNEGVLEAYAAGVDVVIVANDDVVPAPGDIDRVAAKAARCRDRYIVTCAGRNERLGRDLPSLGYSFFAVNPVALETIGCFDENFFPAYCEDQDYARRAALAGLAEENCADTAVVHAGSAAIFASPELALQNRATHSRNMQYYRDKWGGEAGWERYSTPFGDPRFSLRIAPEDRGAPYGPSHDRTDRDLVAL